MLKDFFWAAPMRIVLEQLFFAKSIQKGKLRFFWGILQRRPSLSHAPGLSKDYVDSYGITWLLISRRGQRAWQRFHSKLPWRQILILVLRGR